MNSEINEQDVDGFILMELLKFPLPKLGTQFKLVQWEVVWEESCEAQ